MGKQKSVVKNYIYNLIYQIFLIITPFITTPYVARVLGASGVGQYSFTFSIVTYFTLFAALGFGYYAQREAARAGEDKRKLSYIFWEIFILRLFSVGIVFAVYVTLAICNVYGEYTKLIWLFSMNIIVVALDVSFLFQGREDFGFIAIVNIIVKIFGIVGVFVFVKNENDVSKYILCNSVALVLATLLLWIKVPKVLTKINIKELDIYRHFKPAVKLFIPTIAVSIYTLLDRILVGLIVPGTVEKVLEDGTVVIQKVSDIENGFYEQSEKITKMVLTVVTALGTIMIPRNSKEIASGNFEIFKQNIQKSINFVFFIGIPMMFGLIAVSSNFSPWFFGEGYEKVPNLIKIFSIIILVIGINNLLGLQYLIPLGEDKKFTIAICCGALVNFALNIVMIYYWQSYGAAIASVIAESVITIIMLFYVSKDIKLSSIFKGIVKPLIAGIIMFIPVFILATFVFTPSLLNTLISVVIGIVIYAVCMAILRDEFLMFIFAKVKSKLKKRKEEK